ncbi:ABC transporter ATP-binding protein [Methylocapsa acidiphila]|uniref:ABC transporter ATP-binding protein n=1 Tax=Methylocapsa acidiphila TaxID=133552 RepID=UPI0004047D3E|nr:ABC transporter ATP-binding protein [Methylocapsa acidiphila]
MTRPLLQISGLSVRFGGLTAVDRLDLTVEAGAIHGLIGPNGAGKTTAFNLIAGAVRRSAGEIRLDGAPVEGLPPYARVRRGLARTFQNIRLFGEMTALENILAGMHTRLKGSLFEILLRPDKTRRVERDAVTEARALLDFVGLAAVARRRAGELSYGDQRRVEIARALAAAPKLLLLDEPAAGMNPAETRALSELLQRVKARGVTVLLVEHDMGLVMRLCDKITVLNFGRKIAEGAPREIRADRQVIEAYLGAESAHALASP